MASGSVFSFEPLMMYRHPSHLVPAAFVLMACAASPAAGAAQVDPAIAARVDDIFEQWSTETSPGCAVGVTQNGETLLERAYGMADLEWGIPNTPETIFEGGSVSKQFAAAAVNLLVLDGTLSLDDDVRRWVPELPDYGHTITLHHLMTHTSGLRDWGSVASISGWGREDRAHDHDDIVDILSRQTRLNFEPGLEYSYSNSGYNLLAVVVDRAS
ncbi:MAG: serine hydrolase domain-containing protein, partial [Longimicrobiales bacterium]